MKVKITFWKLDEISDGSETSLLDFGPPAIAAQIVEASSLSELQAHRQAYADMASKTEHCGRVLIYKVGTERAFRGFKEMAAEPAPLVNEHIGRNAAA